MVEQLWYTWTTTGLGSNTGYQILAASQGLRESNSRRYQALRSYLNYELPRGSDLAGATPNNSPITLAFLDPGETTPAEKGQNTRIVLQKSYKGRDAHGRPGVFFAHLIDRLPEDFVASNAINLWGSAFWHPHPSEQGEPRAPLPQNYLESIQQSEKLLIQNDQDTYVPAIAFSYDEAIMDVRDDLPLVIQTFLLLKPGQKLYIAGHWQKVAALIWGLLQSLPRSLQKAQNITFSTYEKEIGQSPARIVGTTRPAAFYQQGGVNPQEILPAIVFTGTGPALALDCDTRNFIKWRSETEDHKVLLQYGEYATDLLVTGEREELARLLEEASETEVKTTDSFLVFIKTHIDAMAKKDWTPDEIISILENRKQAATLLLRENIQVALRDHWLNYNVPEWRERKAQPALAKLRPPALSEIKAEASEAEKKDDKKLRQAFRLLGELTILMLTQELQNDFTYPALRNLLVMCTLAEHQQQLQLKLAESLLTRLVRPGDQFGKLLHGLSWEKRFWLLQQLAGVQGLLSGINEKLVELLLPRNWQELLDMLTTEEKLPGLWFQYAVTDLIFWTMDERNALAFDEYPMKVMLSKHSEIFFSGLGTLLQRPDEQDAAIKMAVKLLDLGYAYTRVSLLRKGLNLLLYLPRILLAQLQALFFLLQEIVLFIPRQILALGRWVLGLEPAPVHQEELPAPYLEWYHWKNILPPFLKLEAAQPISLDALLKAAHLREEDQYWLVEQHAKALFSSSHLRTSLLLDVGKRFIDRLIERIANTSEHSSLKHIATPEIIRALNALGKIYPPHQKYETSVLELKSLLASTKSEDFEQFLRQDGNLFLSSLVRAIKGFSLLHNHVYMNNLYLLIIKEQRDVQQLAYIIDHVSPIFEEPGRKKNHPAERRKLFKELINCANQHYRFPITMLTPYIFLALDYVVDLKPKSQTNFLEKDHVLEALIQLRQRNCSFQELDQQVQNMLHLLLPANKQQIYFDLWRTYIPNDYKRRWLLPRKVKASEEEESQPLVQAEQTRGDAPMLNHQQAAPLIHPQTYSASGSGQGSLPAQNALANPSSSQAGRTSANTSSNPSSQPTSAANPSSSQAGRKKEDISGISASQSASTTNPSISQGGSASAISPSISQGGASSHNSFAASFHSQPTEQNLPTGSQRIDDGQTEWSHTENYFWQRQSDPGETIIETHASLQAQAEDNVLTTILGEKITREQVGGLFMLVERYIPWHISMLKIEHKRQGDLAKDEEDNKRFDKYEEIKAIQFGLINEIEVLEELTSANLQKIRDVLINDVLIKAKIKKDWKDFSAEEEEYLKENAYQKLRETRDYHKVIQGLDERNVKLLLPLCIHYRILGSLLRQQKYTFGIKPWLQKERSQNSLFPDF